jgi:hypothetical protein
MGEKMKNYFIVAAVSLAIGAGSMALIMEGCNKNPSGPMVKNEGPVIEKEKQKPTNCDELTKCYYASMFIRGEFHDKKFFKVTAGTYCKEAEKDFEFAFPEPAKKWDFSISPRVLAGYNAGSFDLLYGGSADLVRNYKLISIGGGPDYLRSIKGTAYYGAHLTLKTSFDSFF